MAFSKIPGFTHNPIDNADDLSEILDRIAVAQHALTFLPCASEAEASKYRNATGGGGFGVCGCAEEGKGTGMRNKYVCVLVQVLASGEDRESVMPYIEVFKTLIRWGDPAETC